MPLQLPSFFRYLSAWKAARMFSVDASVEQGQRRMAKQPATKECEPEPLGAGLRGDKCPNFVPAASKSQQCSRWRDSMAQALYIAFKQEVSFTKRAAANSYVRARYHFYPFVTMPR